jgi:hypothetical protein
MPNGFSGAKSEWARMEAPLLRIDDVLVAFAYTRGLQLSRNYHDWPERSLVWETSSIRKLIQIFLSNDKELTFTVWICASEDRDRQRYWKEKSLKVGVAIEDIVSTLEDLLTEGKEILDSWNRADLEAVSR